MPLRLLIGAPGADWSSVRNENFLNLDVDDASQVPVGRVVLFQNGIPRFTSFLGSRNAIRAPHVLLAGLMQGLKRLGEDGDVQCFAYRDQPLSRQTIQLIADVVQPSEILWDSEVSMPMNGWPVGPEVVELPRILPIVSDAQRKAQWLKLIERSRRHEIPLSSVSLRGLRLLGGENVTAECKSLGINPAWAEVQGKTLFLVSDENLHDEKVIALLDHFHTQRLVSTKPSDYQNLVCAPAREEGEEIGYGRIAEIDFEAGLIIAELDTVEGTPIPVLKVGTMRVDKDGHEDEELTLWRA